MKQDPNPVEKALWFIESHFRNNISLADIARAAGVSRFHMTRSFAAATDRSIMQYVRGRRLSEAAKALQDGASDILSLALDAAYGSHEAFTRAFHDQFGTTPEMVRAQGRRANLALLEPIKLDGTMAVSLEMPRLEGKRCLLIAGLSERYSCESSGAIPNQWQRFLPHKFEVGKPSGNSAFGVRCNEDDEGNFDYICGVEVKNFSNLPSGWSGVRIPEQVYTVFHQPGHISTIRSTWNTILNSWLPQSGFESADAPTFECYGERFNSSTGMGGFEIWVPVRTDRREVLPGWNSSLELDS